MRLHVRRYSRPPCVKPHWRRQTPARQRPIRALEIPTPQMSALVDGRLVIDFNPLPTVRPGWPVRKPAFFFRGETPALRPRRVR